MDALLSVLGELFQGLFGRAGSPARAIPLWQGLLLLLVALLIMYALAMLALALP